MTENPEQTEIQIEWTTMQMKLDLNIVGVVHCW
jgi:hypothetical protein